jgi:hypothetical protein
VTQALNRPPKRGNSSKDPKPLINLVAKLLSSRRLPIHRYRKGGRSKLKITPNGRAQQVTGLIVNAPHGLSVPGRRRDKIRAAIWMLRRVPRQDLSRAVKSIRGKIGYVAQFNRGSASRLTACLDSTLARWWPAGS